MSIEATSFQRMIFFIVVDILAVYLAVHGAFSLRFDFNIPPSYAQNIFTMMIILIPLKVVVFYLSSIYKISWRHFGFKDSMMIIYYSFLITLFFTFMVYFFRYSILVGFPRSVIPIEFFISTFIILGSRIIKRFYLEMFNKNALGIPTLVIAKSHQGAAITRRMQEDDTLWPVAIFDNENNDTKINGVEIKSFEQLKKYHNGIEIAIVSDEFDLEEIYRLFSDFGIKEFKTYNAQGGIEDSFKDLTVEDLLARRPADLDSKKIASFIKDKIVLVTGAGGSIGSEIVKQCIHFGAKKLIALEHSEYNLYKIEQEYPTIIAILQSVVHKEDIAKTFNIYKPEIVIHAAAYKHVPLVEQNINEAIINNIIGTKNIIDIAIKYQVQKVVVISTDKAVRPTNVMGTTKRICELYAQNVQTSYTEIVAVRFGNVLGSSGSVIPKFQKQIQEGKNITVTHPDITRYFMLIEEACQLVLQAGAIGEGGEIFILDMGESVKIVDLAKKMIELSNKKGIEIEFSGLRAGEKLYEELLIDESDCSTQYDSITVAKPTFYEIKQLTQDIKNLLEVKDKLSHLKQMVPEFNHQLNTKG